MVNISQPKPIEQPKIDIKGSQLPRPLISNRKDGEASVNQPVAPKGQVK